MAGNNRSYVNIKLGVPMQHSLKKTFLALSISICLTPIAYATNGLAPTGLGQVHKAMGGAAAGNPQNTTTMMTNPAAGSFVDSGFDVGIELFRPKRTAKNNSDFQPSGTNSPSPDAQGDPTNPPPYDTLNPQGTLTKGTEYSGDGKKNFLIPEFAYNRNYGGFSVGISAYGNGGMNTQYDKSPAFAADALGTVPVGGIPNGQGGTIPAGTTGIPVEIGATPDHQPDSVFNFNSTKTGPKGTTGVNLEQLFIAPTISKKLNAKHSVGLSLNLVWQRFEAKGLSALTAGSTNPTKFTDNGKSSATGIGATIGWMGQFSDRFTMGASYRLKTKMGKFKEYAGLFPDGGEMHVPAALTVGASAKVTPSTTIAADIQQIYYSDVAATGNAFKPSGFGGKDGPGFGWDDQTVIKLGVKQQMGQKLAMLAGYNHGASPVGPEDTFFNALTPAVVEDHLSLGFEYKVGKNSAITGSYTHTFKNEVKGDVAKGQQFDISMEQNAAGIGFSKKF